MAEYTQQELMKMQQEAMRRVNEMNERARRSLHSTPVRGHSQAAPQFERAPAHRTASAENGQDAVPGSARTPATKNAGHTGRLWEGDTKNAAHATAIRLTLQFPRRLMWPDRTPRLRQGLPVFLTCDKFSKTRIHR